MLEQSTQSLRVAIPLPGNVGNAPVALRPDQIDDDLCRHAEVLETDGRDRLVGRSVAHCDVDIRKLPLLAVDEGVEVKAGRILALGGRLSVLDDQRGKRWLEIALDLGLAGD